MSALFDMLIRVPARSVGPIIELIGPDGTVLEVRPAAAKQQRRASNGKAPRGLQPVRGETLPRSQMRGVDLILDVMAGGHEWTYDKLKAAFVHAGKAPNSMSPVLSKRIGDGSIVKVRQGVYRIAPK